MTEVLVDDLQLSGVDRLASMLTDLPGVTVQEVTLAEPSRIVLETEVGLTSEAMLERMLTSEGYKVVSMHMLN